MAGAFAGADLRRTFCLQMVVFAHPKVLPLLHHAPRSELE